MMTLMIMMMTIIILILLIMIIIILAIIHLNSEFIFVLIQQPSDHFGQQKIHARINKQIKTKVNEDHIFMAKQQE
jgi:Na+-transporting methylmalonyl-CoA/oxaloacetate decarboxylase gamma subunit